MITSDSTLREMSAAAFEAGFRITLAPMPTPTRANRLTAEYGPRGTCWRWASPWKRFYDIQPKMSGEEETYYGWERMFLVAAWDEEGNALWDRKYGTLGFISIYDDPRPPWSFQW